jgi:WD40 repeat protein
MLLGQQMWNTGEVGALRRILEVTRPASAQEDYRGWEWYYYQSLLRRDLLTIQHKLIDRIADGTAVDWSPDGRKLAFAGTGVVCLFDSDTGDALRVLSEPFDLVTQNIRAAAWSPDGSRLAWYGIAGHRICRMDQAVPKTASSVPAGDGVTVALSWSPDGTRLALLLAGVETQTEIRELNGGRLVTSVKWDNLLPFAMAWSPDGRHVAVGGIEADEAGTGLIVQEAQLQIADAIQGKVRHTYKGHTDAAQCVAWSPDSKRLVTGSRDGSVIIWNAETGEMMPMLGGHDGCVHAVAWSDDGTRIATGGVDRIIKVWNADNNALLLTFRGHEKTVTSIDWSPNASRLASASEDRTAKVWDVRAAQESFDVRAGDDDITERYSAREIRWSPDSRWLSLQTSRTAKGQRTPNRGIEIFETDTWARVLNEDVGYVNISCAWSRDARQFAYLPHRSYARRSDLAPSKAGMPAQLTVWDPGRQETVRRFEITTEYPALVSYSPTLGHVAIVGNSLGKYRSSDSTIAVWDVTSAKQLSVLKGHAKGIICLRWDPQGGRLASCDVDGGVRIWNLDQQEAVQSFVGATSDDDTELVWRPDGKQLAWCGEGVVIWSIDSPQVQRFPDRDRVRWSHDGARVLADGEKDVSILDARSWERLAALEADPQAASDFVWSPDDKRVALARTRRGMSGRGEIRLWDTATGQPVLTLLGDRAKWLFRPAWSPDGRRIAAESLSGPIRVWDASAGYADL